jgi:glycosyltransferase 2 family protein
MTPQDQDKQKTPAGLARPLWQGLRFVVAAALIAYVVRILGRQWGDVAATLKRLSPLGLLAASIALGLYYATAVQNWRALMSKLGAPLSLPVAFRIVFLSNLAKFLPGGVWNLVGRVALCKQRGVAVTVSSLSLFIELVSTLAAMAVTSMVTLSASEAALLPVPRSVLLLGLVAVAVGLHPWVLNFALRLLARLTKGEVMQVEASYAFMLWVWFRYLVTWLLAGGTFLLLANALFAQRISLDQASLLMGAISIAWLLGLFAFVVPGGLGVREVVLTTLLSTQFGPGIAAALALAFRLLLVIPEVVLFLVALAVGRETAGVPTTETGEDPNPAHDNTAAG